MAVQLNEAKVNRIKEIAARNGGLCEALWNCAYRNGNGWYWEVRQKAWALLERAIGKPLTEVSTVEEFWKPSVEMAVRQLTGEHWQKDFVEMMRIQLECQFSSTMVRRSYRTKNFGWHAAKLVDMLYDWIRFTLYGKTAEEMLPEYDNSVLGYGMFMALELRRGNPVFDSAVQEAILGENQNVLLTGTMIRAIIVSGREDLLELLLKLLSAARLQEGLRQQILENADAGSMQIMKRILKFCIDEDMFRYSSVVRAFYTWTGLYFGDEKPGVMQKYAHFALQCLEESKTREQYIESANNLEAYLALWALASQEMERADCLVANLLDAGEKYRRILGWYFITHSDSKKFRMRMAARYLQERDPEILAWIVGNLAQTSDLIYSYGASAGNRKVRAVVNQDLPDDREERRRIFYQLKELIIIVGTSEAMYTGNPFPFSGIRMESDKVINCMMSLAGYDMNEELVEALHSCMPDMTPDQRRAYYHKFLRPEVNELHKAYLMEALQDKSVQVKALAAEMLAQCRLTEDELDALAECLKSKSSSLRKNVLITLQKQEPKVQTRVLQKLLASGEQFQIQAGIELLMELKAEAPELVTVKKEAIAVLRTQKLSTQTEILLKQLEGSSEAQLQYTEENGYGLYEGAVLSKVLAQAAKELEGKTLSERELEKLLFIDKEEYFALLERMDQVFNRNANYEYETRKFDGSVEKILFGDTSFSWLRLPIQSGDNVRILRPSPETIPFFEEFLKALGEYATDVTKMLALRFAHEPYSTVGEGKRQLWYENFLKKPLFAAYHKEGYQKYHNRYYCFLDIIGALPLLFPAHEIFEGAFRIFQGMVRLVGIDDLGKNFEPGQEQERWRHLSYRDTPCLMNERILGFWRRVLSANALEPEDFRRWFYAEYYLEQILGNDVKLSMTLTDKEFFRAHAEGLVPADVIYAHYLAGAFRSQVQRGRGLASLTNPGRYEDIRELYKLYPEAKEMVRTLVLRIVGVEEKRGELATPLTGLAQTIVQFEGGAEHFVKLLAALGNENFFRGYQYGSMETKQAILSLLLKRCYPTREDGPKQLKQYLKQTDITEKRLAEAVMYAPQWASLAEQVTGWKGLKSGIWFFHAHVNEMFSAEKETEVALYSPITPRQFNDGAFDKDWFQQTYQMLGEKRFQTLYRCAKYICFGNSSHRRSQLYADAVLGKLDADVVKAEIIEKRNQEKLRCYPLIPIPEGDVKTALERYEFIQRFLKESKQFGAQRRENERKACNVAMENLAITIGFYDVNRMTWYLESEKINEIRTLMEPQKLQDVSIWVEINEEGIAQLAVEKGGKRQKSVPKEWNKDPLVLELKAAIKELKEQRSRAKEILERAMAESTLFSGEEIRKISENPVLFPLIQRLVWVQEAEKTGATELAERVKRKGAADRTKEAEIAERKEDLKKSKKFVAMILGFLKMGELLCLMDVGGTVHPLEDNAKYRVAHPHDMMQADVWSEFMQLLYREQLVQPFKQVFREYYPITEDERQERTVSRRYAGHQVQPQKTVALLRSRGWTVDYEEGLQKVFYKENLMVRMFAMADWFSPADIEAPTLEVIRFFDRNTGDVVEFTQVPPVVFSEVMRDIDLVVSVAHVGGVDPEASHSTVEMRTAIAVELTKLLKLSNVTFIGSHAKISGSLASYSVHMGSGVVHAEAIGMLNILPVHSQARGRIFLPFADDDPKTAEIMSKIILLAEDKKIKDPSVLQQLR